MLASTLRLASTTFATMVLLPPVARTIVGLAPTEMLPTAADPIAIFTVRESVVAVVPPVPVVAPVLLPAPPDDATIVAVPDAVPARNLTTTRPLRSVSASGG